MDAGRRRFITGMAGILVSAAAPAIITTPGLLMPVRKLVLSDEMLTFYEDIILVDQVRSGKDLMANYEYWKRVIDATCGIPMRVMPVAPAGFFRDKA